MSRLTLALALLSFLVCLASVAGSRHIVEMKIFVDRKGVAKWKQLLEKKEDSDLRAAADVLFDEMNVLFSTLQPNVAVQLKLKELVLLDEDVFTTDPLQRASAVYQAYTFINKDKSDFDAAMLFTGINITSELSGYKAFGVSYHGRVCTEFKTGTTEIFTGRTMAIMTAHEIAHILGAPHDESCDRGWWAKGNLMNTATLLESPNVETFSYCSKKYIYDKIYELDRTQTNCLQDNNVAETPDEVCKDVYGDSYSMNRGKYDPAGYSEDFCTRLHCVAKLDDFVYKSMDMPDRMSCGRKKRCVDKKCVEVDDGDYRIPDRCPFGDQNLSEWGYKTLCPKKTCSGNWWKYCCKSCEDEIDLRK